MAPAFCAGFGGAAGRPGSAETIDLAVYRSAGNDSARAYHDAIDEEIFYAVLPYPGCSGCLGGEDDFDALTSTTSHELAEGVTDPVPGMGWYDDAHGEVGDICAWRAKRLGDYLVQLEWSNAAGDCV